MSVSLATRGDRAASVGRCRDASWAAPTDILSNERARCQAVTRTKVGATRFQIPQNAGDGARLEGFLATYFSLQIITANSLGDIAPASNIGRVFTLAEAIVGMFYLAIFISRLVGAYAYKPSPTARPADDSPPEYDG